VTYFRDPRRPVAAAFTPADPGVHVMFEKSSGNMVRLDQGNPGWNPENVPSAGEAFRSAQLSTGRFGENDVLPIGAVPDVEVVNVSGQRSPYTQSGPGMGGPGKGDSASPRLAPTRSPAADDPLAHVPDSASQPLVPFHDRSRCRACSDANPFEQGAEGSA